MPGTMGDDSLGHGEVPGVPGATGLGQQKEGNASDGSPAGTSCFIILTLVMVHIFDDYMNFYSLGDSNIILVRNNRATLLNYKQNYITLMIRKFAEGGIDTADAYRDTRAKGLIDFVGNLKCKVLKTSKPIRLVENDIIIVSSDGVTDSIPLNRLVNHIHFDQNAAGIARSIKYGVKTRKNPRQDNYSAIVIKMKRSYV